MIADANVKVISLDLKNKRIEIRSPKYSAGSPIVQLDAKYEGRPVKLITDWSDLPRGGSPVRINGCSANPRALFAVQLSRGTFIECSNDVTVYVVTSEAALR